jgi:hypothetical protein
MNTRDLAKDFLKVTEAELLVTVGETLKDAFSPTVTIPAHVTEDGIFVAEKTIPNPRATIPAPTQVSIIINVTFHLLAQQLAIMFMTVKSLNRKDVMKTTMDNLKRLTIVYLRDIRDAESGKDGESHAG